MRMGQSAADARAVVSGVEGAYGHEFWPDSVSIAAVEFNGVIGHRQATDAFLAQLAHDARHLREDV